MHHPIPTPSKPLLRGKKNTFVAPYLLPCLSAELIKNILGN